MHDHAHAKSISPLCLLSTPNHFCVLCSQTQSYLDAKKWELEFRNLFFLYCINHKFKCWYNSFTNNTSENCTAMSVIAQKGGVDRESVVRVAIRYKLDGLGIESW